MNRRKFHQKIALGLPALLLSFKEKEALTGLLPKRLQAGHTIGLITPGSFLSDDGLEKAIQQITNLGFKVKVGKNIRAQRGYNAGTDQQRLDDLHSMFQDEGVDGIWCARGGYGCSRLLPHINYRLIKRNPKVLIGYSDITALLNAIYLKTGLIGFHGPVGASDFTDYTLSSLKGLVMENGKGYVIKPSGENLDKANSNYHPEVIRGGRAEGRLIGGNLSLLAAMAGTGYLPNVKGKIVCIEEIGEKPYRVDRMLTQLRQACKLEKAAGIAMGVFADCEADEDDRSLSLLETIRDRTKDLGIPVVYGLSFGHISDQCTLPIGANAKLDVEAHSLEIVESVNR